MTTTFVTFLPSDDAPFQFQPLLDSGQQFLVTVPFNEFGQRYFITVTDLSGVLIVSRGLAPTGPTINGVFTWAAGVATVETQSPHLVPVGQVANIRITNSDSPFDGFYEALATGETELTYALPANPLEAGSILGQVNFDLDLLAGYGIGHLWYHEDSRQFEY